MHDTSHTSQHPDVSLSPAHSLSLLDQKKRNLVNQRNFRSRRKQYVTELEEKLHAYQQAGVSATKQVQAVARAVAEENAVLRRFVREGLGWSEARLGWEVSNAMGVNAKEGMVWQQQRQQEEVAVVTTSTPQRQPLGRDTFEQRREYSSGHRHREFTPALTPEMPAHVQSAGVQKSPIDSGVQSSPANCCTTSKPDTQRTNPEPIHTDTLTPDDPSSTTDHNDNHDNHDDRTDNENENEKDNHDDNNIDHEHLPPPQPPPTTTTPSCMSCEQAATILSELRAPPNMTMDMDQIRQELGCSASLALATCRVTHEKLFQKLDDSV